GSGAGGLRRADADFQLATAQRPRTLAALKAIIQSCLALRQCPGLARVEAPAYEAIEMPRNSPAGFITAFFATVMGFSLIWQIWWLAILNFLAAAIVVLIA